MQLCDFLCGKMARMKHWRSSYIKKLSTPRAMKLIWTVEAMEFRKQIAREMEAKRDAFSGQIISTIPGVVPIKGRRMKIDIPFCAFVALAQVKAPSKLKLRFQWLRFRGRNLLDYQDRKDMMIYRERARRMHHARV